MALGVEPELGRRQRVAALVVALEGFGAVRAPLHRPAEPPRGPGDEDVLRIDEVLHAEAAAHVGRPRCSDKPSSRNDPAVLRVRLTESRSSSSGGREACAAVSRQP